ncbi:hypothetical protein SteCoe_30011 [Stentor coeruleus]|uniref:Uncharacterized protein n=1 Tax=Stentor coeruleus TaxID=5963 RepID=A0A1R2B4H7_9CILI|nr:hypothetical protein SteCoe_30011 [Stentor coeruleus]
MSSSIGINETPKTPIHNSYESIQTPSRQHSFRPFATGNNYTIKHPNLQTKPRYLTPSSPPHIEQLIQTSQTPRIEDSFTKPSAFLQLIQNSNYPCTQPKHSHFELIGRNIVRTMKSTSNLNVNNKNDSDIKVVAREIEYENLEKKNKVGEKKHIKKSFSYNAIPKNQKVFTIRVKKQQMIRVKDKVKKPCMKMEDISSFSLKGWDNDKE